MITGRLPFPDAKGPAGLITAQLKQTPQPPSTAYPAAGLPQAADRVILKCLEKDKNNRYPDVPAFSAAMQEVIAQHSPDFAAMPNTGRNQQPALDMLETVRREAPTAPASSPALPRVQQMAPQMIPQSPPPYVPPPRPLTPPSGIPHSPYPQQMPNYGSGPVMSANAYPPAAQYQQQAPLHVHPVAPKGSSAKFIWWIVALLAVGVGIGTTIALLASK